MQQCVDVDGQMREQECNIYERHMTKNQLEFSARGALTLVSALANRIATFPTSSSHHPLITLSSPNHFVVNNTNANALSKSNHQRADFMDTY